MSRKTTSRKRITRSGRKSAPHSKGSLARQQQKVVGTVSIVLILLLALAVIFVRFSSTGDAIRVADVDAEAGESFILDFGEDGRNTTAFFIDQEEGDPARYGIQITRREDGSAVYVIANEGGVNIIATDTFTYLGERSNVFLNADDAIPDLQIKYLDHGIQVSENIEQIVVNVNIPHDVPEDEIPEPEPVDDGDDAPAAADDPPADEPPADDDDSPADEPPADDDAPEDAEEITMHLDYDEDEIFSNSFEVEVSARHLEDKEYDVRVWVEDNNGTEISERYDRRDDAWRSTRNFIRNFLDGPGNDDKTIILRLNEVNADYIGDAELHFEMKDGDDFEEDIEEDIEFLEGAGERDDEAVQDATCTQEWDCTEFSSCRNGIQTRSCRRDDDCSQKIRVGDVDRIITVERPAERQACLESDNPFREEFDQDSVTNSPEPSRAVCSPNEKRCFGDILQRCSFDGNEWETLETCTDRCDSFSLACVENEPTKGDSSGIPGWVLPVIGIIVLLGVITVLVVMIIQRRKKFGPATKYIKSSRDKGISDSTTRMRLISQGWDPDHIDKLMK
jgi:hypothetical protein